MNIIKHGDIIDCGTHLERVPMTIRCDCGSILELWDSWANGCNCCHREYNSGGQQLASREFWGEETGEHYADVRPGEVIA